MVSGTETEEEEHEKIKGLFGKWNFLHALGFWVETNGHTAEERGDPEEKFELAVCVLGEHG